MRLLLVCSLLLHVFITCQTFYASPIMKVTSRSLNQFVGLKQLATILNVTSIGNWSLYMELPLTNGSIGSSQIQETTIDCIMSRWSIPSEFLDEGIRNVKLLIFGIDEGSSVSQLFIFDTKSGISLSTLLIEAKRLNSSSIINVNYIIINSNAMIKQQYTHVIQRNCHRCANCFWRRDCCLLINTLLSNQSKDLDTNKQQFNIIRISKFNQYGEFFDENLLTRYPLWKSETTKIVLNMFRFIAAVKLNPEKPRLLSAFFENQLNNNNNHHHHRERRGAFLDKVNALSNAVKNAAEAWKSIAGALKTSTSKTIERTTRFGFTYFQQKSTVLQVMNIPSKRAEQFLNAIQIDYDLPTKASFMLGLTYSEQFAWERVDYLYSPTNNGKYRFLTLYKNADRINKTASFFLVDINSDWQIANDLLIVKKSRSVLGGLFENTKQYIQEIPHVLTVEEADQLRQFFTLVSMSHLASILRVNVTLPQLNQTFSK
ncbi:hypothetical protein I4U23_016084 [Adineta vaga]|nr:hypothetical protein I4U23_016084 [Adineta vaga]